MFRQLTTELDKIALRWAAQPLWAASLVCLLVMLVVSGPLACFAHCAILGETHSGLHHHHHHADHLGSTAESALAQGYLLIAHERGDHAICANLMSQSADMQPSALTVGVVLAALFIPQLATTMLRRLNLKPQLRFLALPPPPDPPRFAPGLTV